MGSAIPFLDPQARPAAKDPHSTFIRIGSMPRSRSLPRAYEREATTV